MYAMTSFRELNSHTLYVKVEVFGLWCHAMLLYDTNISEVPGGSMDL